MADGSKLARALDRALPEDADHVALREQASALLRAHVGFEMAVWATVDPLTTMWTSCVVDGAPRDESLEADVFANEYGVPDVLKLTDLAHGRTHGGSRSFPNHHSAMKVLSRKNAMSTSSARGTPKMLPTKREYSLQFIPNWNSCTIPVTTPTAKLIRNRWPKKLARFS